jgi:hypothetical protein
MKINRQLQILLDEAPQSGVSPLVMEKAVIPVLKAFASQLQHLEYYVVQSRDRDWLITTLTHLERPQQEKRVIYAFATSEDAASSQSTSDSQILIESIPVTHLLFQLFALDGVNSLIFLETPGNLEKGREIPRASLQNSIQQQLQQLKNFPVSQSKNIPANLA